jgi:hypothetical protein
MESSQNYIAEHNDLYFIIEEDYPDVGAYLYVMKESRCIKDHLQENSLACKEIALEEYGVPLEAWSR